MAVGGEVVCHNDLSLKNTVYRTTGDRLLPVAFLDWDLAAPGRRIDDVAHVCWQWAAGATSTIEQAGPLVRAAADAYDLTPADRAGLVKRVMWWQDRCWRGIQAKIDAGDPSVRRLAAAGAVDAVRADWEWTGRHSHALQTALA